MALKAAAAGGGSAIRLWCSCFSYQHFLLLKPTKIKLMVSNKLFFNTQNLSASRTLKGSFAIYASDPSREEESSSNNGLSQDDFNYVWKLGAGSVAGAAIIKYGSILFPDITRPNIFQALVMISTPVIIALALLIKQSRSE